MGSGDCFRGGSGDRLLLLHSGLGTWREWRCLVDRLGETREVMAPTLPGSLGGPPLELGDRSMLDAMADHVESVLDDAGWDEPVAIVGSSHGGVIALELAARRRAASVVALAPPWMSVSTGALYGGLFGLASAWLRLTTPLHARTARLSRAGGLIMHGSLSPARFSPDDLADTLRSVSRYPFLSIGRHGVRAPLLPDFDRIDCPVVLIWGTSDRLAPYGMSRRWTEAIPHAELVTLRGFPHIPQLRDPDRLARLILEHAQA